ncbi:bacillithiol system redox-active protein YtxJ [Evansella sp. LMS18]|uniref:bacillithiol system redox-active protein YtxJ n=1 Tax=Evansella sp. LMS18 TaxID=2924033 RepID=UPI0020D150EF|nr:bacillithiol system redox-active protein YtxJ [Evansella sp. LMS18]UTR11418.1 bacillithiol system redox-active protein YtxJ [Evansella sp. LMS18]
MALTKIEEEQQFEEVLKEQETLILLKNSTTCPISHEAFKETENFAGENDSVPVYYLNVQELRDLSNEVAEKYNVKHESPQALLFSDGKVSWHASHWKVTKKELAKAWENK